VNDARVKSVSSGRKERFFLTSSGFAILLIITCRHPDMITAYCVLRENVGFRVSGWPLICARGREC